MVVHGSAGHHRPGVTSATTDRNAPSSIKFQNTRTNPKTRSARHSSPLASPHRPSSRGRTEYLHHQQHHLEPTSNVPGPYRSTSRNNRESGSPVRTSSLYGVESHHQQFHQHQHQPQQQQQQPQQASHLLHHHHHLSHPTQQKAVQDGEAVCNYDTDVTKLYELLESSNWEKAQKRCSTHPEEAKTWIIRRDSASQKIRWKLLPLHAAVIFQSPTFVVSSLIDHYPAAVSRKDDQGMLPLHLAFRYKEDSEELLETLLQKYPQGVLMKDKRDRSPLEHGRGSKFSGKLMRLYSEACIATSTSATNNDSHRVGAMIAEYDNKMKTLKGMYEERIKILHDQHQSALHQVQLASEEEHRKFQMIHAEEMEDLRELMSSEVGKDGAVISDMQSELHQVRDSLRQVKAERDIYHRNSTELREYADDITLQLQKVLQDQDTMQAMVSQQQKELEKLYNRREQLLQSILRQEQDDRATRTRREHELDELMESIRLSLESSIARKPPSTSIGTNELQGIGGTGAVGGVGVGVTGVVGAGPSGEIKRKNGAVGAGGLGGGVEGRDISTPLVREGVVARTGPYQLKDDISAITENSNF